MTITEKYSRKDIKILIVDDDEYIREFLYEAIQHEDYNCRTAVNGVDASEKLKQEHFDIVITDIQMPDMDGVELLNFIKLNSEASVIMMTGNIKDYLYEKMIDNGASDFLYKPFRINEMIVRLKRVIHERNMVARERRVSRELQDAYLDTINRLALAAELKDEDTGDHVIRMSKYCSLIAEEMGMTRTEVDNIRLASPMHDVGKIGIPDKILLKKGRLTDEEFEVMKGHTIIGAKILENPTSEMLKIAKEIAISHHEKWNGLGYPYKLKGTNIPLVGRIVGVADVFDALTSARPYKDPYPIEIAVEIIKKERGKHFDPDVVDVFLKNIENIANIKEYKYELTAQSFKWSDRDSEYKNDIIK